MLHEFLSGRFYRTLSMILGPRTTFGQFDCNSPIASLMSAIGITPRRARPLSIIETASSGTDCQLFPSRADAFSGRSTKAPGGTTLAMNSDVVAPATTLTLGWERGGSGAARTTRTFVVAPSAQRSIRPVTSCSDGIGFVLIFEIESESGPPDGLGVRASCQVPNTAACSCGTAVGFDFISSRQRVRKSSFLRPLQRSTSLFDCGCFAGP